MVEHEEKKTLDGFDILFVSATEYEIQIQTQIVRMLNLSELKLH